MALSVKLIVNFFVCRSILVICFSWGDEVMNKVEEEKFCTYI